MQQRSERWKAHNEAPTNMSDSKATQQREGFPFCTHKQLLINTKQPSSCWSLPLAEKLKTSPWLLFSSHQLEITDKSCVKPLNLHVKLRLLTVCSVLSQWRPKQTNKIRIENKKKYLWVSSSVSHRKPWWPWREEVALYSIHTYLHTCTYTWALPRAGTVKH